MHPIDIGRLEHPAVRDYLTNSDRRIQAGARFVIDTLEIPFPNYFERRPAGRPFANRVMADFRKDNPETLYEATMRKSREHAARLHSREQQH